MPLARRRLVEANEPATDTPPVAGNYQPLEPAAPGAVLAAITGEIRPAKQTCTCTCVSTHAHTQHTHARAKHAHASPHTQHTRARAHGARTPRPPHPSRPCIGRRDTSPCRKRAPTRLGLAHTRCVCRSPGDLAWTAGLRCAGPASEGGCGVGSGSSQLGCLRLPRSYAQSAPRCRRNPRQLRGRSTRWSAPHHGSGCAV